MTFKYWNIEREDSGLAWALLDCPGQSTNALSAAVMEELGQVLDAFDAAPPKGLIFKSGKSAGFIAGADINEFGTLDTGEKARAVIARGWHLFNRLAAVPYPTLSLIRGHCLGGGLELSLACRYRIAVDEPATRLGLPEVLLGIVPGWGGMLRLPQVAGPQVALDMMLTGKTIDARKARKLGVIDLAVAPRIMDAAARGLVLSGQPPAVARGIKGLMNRRLLRGFVGAGARKQVARRARQDHYPAPYAIIELWEMHDGNALAAPDLIDRLIASPTAANLLRVFHLQERLKSFGKESDSSIGHVHVVGAGVMGADIAAVCVQRGLTVTLQDQNLERIAAAIARLSSAFSRRYKDPLQLRAAFDRLIPDVAGDGVVRADVVIEAIYENLEAKRTLLRELEAGMRPDAVLGTNTSSLRIEDLREGLFHPQRLVGIHFFNPVAKMPLVEVVAAEGCDPAMVTRACAFVRRIDKLPLPVRSAPGFLVNAVLAPYMLEAMRCVDEGVQVEAIDKCMREFGMPLGPIELADTVGLDIAIAAGRQLAAGAEVPRCLADLVAAGKLGRKTGQGFYAYEKDRPVKAQAGPVPDGLDQRLVSPIINTSRAIVAAGIVTDAELADAGVIFGTGFAPFRGGPIRYGEQSNVSFSAVHA